jgi:hypothetical protein
LPCKLNCCGLSALLSEIASFVKYRFAAVGLKLTVIEQEALTATAPPQVFVWEKTATATADPVTSTLVIVRACDPVLVRVTCVELVVLTFTRPKFSFAGTSFTVPFVRVIAAPPVWPGSLTEVAIMSTAVFAGVVEGAVYVVASPLAVLVGDAVPQFGEHVAPFCVAAQVTPLFEGAFISVAVNCCMAFTPMSTEEGDTETEIGVGMTVTVADADLVASVTEVAMSVTAGFTGSIGGAV